MRGRGRLAVVVILLCLSGIAGAHDLAVSAIRFIVRCSDTVVSVSFHRSKIARSDVDRVVRERLKIRMDGKPFEPASSQIIDDKATDLVTWQAVCRGTGHEFEVESRLFPEDPAARTVVTVARDGRVEQEVVLDAQNPSWLRSQPAVSAAEVAQRFVVLGVEHILSGLDHVLFVLGLILFGGTLRSLLKTVTAFTIAHSITLSLAATGLLNPSPSVIEPLIALSIVAIAAENLRPKAKGRSRDFRPAMAFLFGLVHGFGFAGAMAGVGLVGPNLAMALGTFNVGVECGQAVVILLAWPLIQLVSRKQPAHWMRFAAAGSALIGVIGAYWFVTRILGF